MIDKLIERRIAEHNKKMYELPYNERHKARVEIRRKKKTKKTFNEYAIFKASKGFKRWRDKQLKTQLGQCYYCECDLSKVIMNVEHIIPMSKRGTNSFKNMVIACSKCNKDKGSTLIPKEKRMFYKKRMYDKFYENQRIIKAKKESINIEADDTTRPHDTAYIEQVLVDNGRSHAVDGQGSITNHESRYDTSDGPT